MGRAQGETGNGILATLAAPGISATARSRTDVTDHDLVQAVRAGDDHAFERLYHRYHRRIAAYIFGMVHDHGRAEDLTQEVFVSALRRMRQTDRAIAFKPWIYEIAKNASIDAFRRARRAEEVSYDADEGLGAADHVKLAATSPSPDAAVDAKQDLDHLCGAFGGLSDAHHEILVLRELEGLSYREIGERLGMSRPSVESTLFRARRRLTQEYEELVTGERCLRVQAIIAGAAGSSLGTRDTRRVGSHISHCGPCRRHAVSAGLDAAVMARRPRRARARIGAFLPLPAFLRRRWLPDGSGDAAGAHVAQHSSSLVQASMAAAQYGEPAMSAWVKAGAVAAAVAMAGVGTGAVEHGAAARGHGTPAVKQGMAARSSGAGTAGASRAAGPGASAPATATPSPSRLRASAGTSMAGHTVRGAVAPSALGSAGAGSVGAPASGPGAGGGPTGSSGADGGSSSSGSADSGSSAAGKPSASKPTSGADAAAGAVQQAASDAAEDAGTAVGAATGGAVGAATSTPSPLVQPDLTALTQPPAAAPPSSLGGAVQGTADVVGGTVGGRVGGAVRDTGAALGGTVDHVTGGVVGGLLGGP
jgi:RNA polymerase sigma factor (sigma-70 family)